VPIQNGALIQQSPFGVRSMRDHDVGQSAPCVLQCLAGATHRDAQAELRVFSAEGHGQRIEQPAVLERVRRGEDCGFTAVVSGVAAGEDYGKDDRRASHSVRHRNSRAAVSTLNRRGWRVCRKSAQRVGKHPIP